VSVDINPARPELSLGVTSSRRRFPVLIILCLIFAAIVAFCAIFGSLVAPHDANEQDLLNTLQHPSWDHLFGTDTLGRDIFSRVIVGARTAVAGPLVIALGAMLIGNTLGVIAGYRGGRVDFVIMRFCDMMFALPALLVAIVVVGVLGGGYWLAVTLLMILTIPYDARLIRGSVLEQRPRPYVEAVRVLGLKPRQIMFGQVWPNVLPVVVANTFLNFAFSLVSLSGLSYLGLGAGPGTADWGRMIADNRNLLFQNPVAALAPALVLVATATTVNLLGDWLYERLSDRGRAR
jgi:peptide/nickel transport system permease protein